jgi:hypothetical protein
MAKIRMIYKMSQEEWARNLKKVLEGHGSWHK